MIRPSQLDVSLYCPQAHKLGEQHGAGRAAFKGKTFHACCAEAPEVAKLMVQLTPEEMEEILTWYRPGYTSVNGVELHYEYAEKELPVVLRDNDKLMTKGTLDMAWMIDDVVYVGDIKKSKWTVSGPDCLQLHAYGMAYAARMQAKTMVCGIFAATEGEWMWGHSWDLLWDYEELMHPLRVATSNDEGEACTGPHCKELCYGRFHCPEYCLPNTSFLAIPPASKLTDKKVTELLLAAQAVEDQVKVAKEFCKEYARRNGGLYHEGQVYKPTQKRGRERVVGVKKLRELLGDAAENCIITGENTTQYRWTKEEVR